MLLGAFSTTLRLTVAHSNTRTIIIMQICKTRAFNHNFITYKHNYSKHHNMYYHHCSEFPYTANAISVGSDLTGLKTLTHRSLKKKQRRNQKYHNCYCQNALQLLMFHVLVILLSIFRLVNSFFHQFTNMVIILKVIPVMVLLMVSTEH